MQITDEMVEAAFAEYNSPKHDLRSDYDAMRAALEAALGQFMLQYGDNVELQEAEQIGFNRAAACIEDLAEDLKEWSNAPSPSPYDSPHYEARQARSIATLEKWGLK